MNSKEYRLPDDLTERLITEVTKSGKTAVLREVVQVICPSVAFALIFQNNYKEIRSIQYREHRNTSLVWQQKK